LKKLNPEKIIIVGGPVAVSKEVEAELGKIATVERIWGENREETAVEVAEHTDGAKAIDTIVIANGDNPSADGVFIANGYRAPIVYVSEKKLLKVTREFLEQHKRTNDAYRKPMKVVFVGVSEEVQSEIEDLMSL
jgi:putative cell wall-binding protein